MFRTWGWVDHRWDGGGGNIGVGAGGVHQHQSYLLFLVQQTTSMRDQGFFLTSTRQTLKRDHARKDRVTEQQTDYRRETGRYVSRLQGWQTSKDVLLSTVEDLGEISQELPLFWWQFYGGGKIPTLTREKRISPVLFTSYEKKKKKKKMII